MCDLACPLTSLRPDSATLGGVRAETNFIGRFGNNLGQYATARYWAEQVLEAPLEVVVGSPESEIFTEEVLPHLHPYAKQELHPHGNRTQPVMRRRQIMPRMDTFNPRPSPGLDARPLSPSFVCTWMTSQKVCRRLRERCGVKGIRLVFHGQYMPQYVFSRLGHDLRRHALSWWRLHERNDRALRLLREEISSNDVVIHLRMCRGSATEPLSSMRNQRSVLRMQWKHAFFPAAFYDRLLVHEVAPWRRLWLVGGGEWGCSRDYNPLVKHLIHNYGARRAPHFLPIKQLPSAASARSRQLARKASLVLNDFEVMRHAVRLVVSHGSTYSCWAALLNSQLKELHVPVRTPDDALGCQLFPGAALNNHSTRVFLHAGPLELWSGAIPSSTSPANGAAVGKNGTRECSGCAWRFPPEN